MDAVGFTFKRVETREELEAVFRLRYQVYVVERGFESAADHPGGLEFDEFDPHSIHFIGLDPRGRAIGTMRLVRPSRLGLPLQRYCRLDVDLSRIPREQLAEISRTAISRVLRRRSEDSPDGLPAATRFDLHQEGGRRQRRIALGLYKVMWRESKWLGLTDWCCAIPRAQFLLLKRYGFLFTQIGPEVDYHGKRAPFVARVGEIEGNMARTKPDIFKFFTDWPAISRVRL